MDLEYKKKVDKVHRKLNYFQSEDSEDEGHATSSEVRRARQRLLRRSANAATSDPILDDHESSTVTVPDLTIRSIKSGEEEDKEEQDSQLKDAINNTYEFEDLIKEND